MISTILPYLAEAEKNASALKKVQEILVVDCGSDDDTLHQHVCYDVHDGDLRVPDGGVPRGVNYVAVRDFLQAQCVVPLYKHRRPPPWLHAVPQPRRILSHAESADVAEAVFHQKHALRKKTLWDYTHVGKQQRLHVQQKQHAALC